MGRLVCEQFSIFLLSEFEIPLFELGPGSIVDIVTGYGLNSPAIESRWELRFSAPVQTGPGSHSAYCKWVPVISRGKERPGRDADPHPLLLSWS
jgi:hypothetical protein